MVFFLLEGFCSVGGNVLAAFLLGLGVAIFGFGTLNFPFGFSLGLRSVPYLLVLSTLIWIVIAFAKKRVTLPVFGFLLPVLFSILCSDSILGKFGFYGNTANFVDCFLVGLLVALFFGASSSKYRYQSISKGINFGTLILVQILVSLAFLSHARGRLLFSDDHPSFLYRFLLLAEHFPDIPFYNPDWNMGYLAREFFPSGILNAFFLVSPVIAIFGPETLKEHPQLYSALIPYLFVIIIPLSVYAASKLMRFDGAVSVVAGIFSLAPTVAVFEWVLKYGTIGFCLSAGLIPLTMGLAVRISISDRAPRWWQVFALLVLSFCVFTWSLSFLAFIPVSIYALWRYDYLLRWDRVGKILVFVMLFSIINGPWMTIFVQESNVLGFLKRDQLPGVELTETQSKQESKAHKPAKLDIDKVIAKLRGLLARFNPVILLLGLGGVFLLRRKRSIWVIGSSCLWLFFIAAVGSFIKPQLELHRMSIPASYLLCIPSAAAVVYLLERASLNYNVSGLFWQFFARLVQTLYVSFLLSLLFSPVYVSAINYQNRGTEKFAFSGGDFEGLTAAISRYPKEGRVFFLGFILHELEARTRTSQDGGHVAPIPHLTGREAIASEFYHTRWSAVDPIPEVFRKRGRDGVEEYLDLVNAKLVVTFLPEWSVYCASKPETYRLLWKGHRFFSIREDSV